MSKGVDGLLSSTAGQYAVLAAVGTVAFIIVHNLLKKDIKDTKNAIGDGISEVAEGVGGVISGHNTITADTAYDGFGVFGTLGAITDSAGGGLFSRVGEWLGGQLSDVGDYFEDTPQVSASNQSSSGNPYGYGTSKVYKDAVNFSPVQASVAASPWAIQPDFVF